MPFPLGQVWFLHDLFFIYLFSLPALFLGSKYPAIFIFYLFFSLSLGTVQFFTPINVSFNILSHNLYSPLANIGFFTLGSLVFSNKHIFTKHRLFIAIIIVISLILLLSLYINFSDGLDVHKLDPNIYYMLCSLLPIFLVLMYQKELVRFCESILIFQRFLLFMSKHSMSVYLSHSLVLFLIHKFLIGSIAGQPLLAALKIISVIFITCIISVPISHMTEKLKKIALSYIK